MPVVTRYPTTDTAISGTWTTPTAVQGDDGVVASTSITTALTTHDRQQGGYGFDSVLPVGAVINSVLVEVRHRVTTVAGNSLLENLVAVSGTLGAANSDSDKPTTLTVRSYAVTRPGGGSWTRADLLDGVFTTRLRARRGPELVDVRVTEVDDTRVTEVDDTRVLEESDTTETPVGFEWDYVRVLVDYTDTSLIVQVRQGQTVIATRFLTLPSGTEADFVLELNPAEVAAITDASNLTVVLTSGLTGQRVTSARLELTGTPVVVVDTTPPTVVNRSPAAGGTNIAIASPITIEFSEPIKRGTGTIVLRTAANQVVETFAAFTSNRITISGSTFTVDPTADLNFSTTYFLDIPAGAILDLADNAYSGSTSYSFTTQIDNVGPAVVAYDPAIAATGVPIAPTITLTFNEDMQRGTGSIVLRTSTGVVSETFNAATSPAVTVSGNVVTIVPTVALVVNFTYFLDIPAGAFRDLQGNNFAGTTTYSFQTITQAVSVSSFEPANGATDVPVLSTPVLTFNVPVRAGTGVIALYRAPNVLVETFNVQSSLRLTFAGPVVYIDPTEALENGRVYYFTIPAGAITDLAGNAYVGTSSYSFTTATTGVVTTMPTAPKLGFWIALADANHNKGTVEIQLSPAPSKVDYPATPLGEIIETADGRVVTQQTNRDPRRRGWIWLNFGPQVVRYERQYRWLEGLRSRVRQQAGQSPYIYVYDGTTNLLNKRSVLAKNAATLNGARTVFTVADMSTEVVPSQLANAVVDVYIGTETSARQRSTITAATNTTITVDPPIDASVTGTFNLKITYLEPAWWRVRVLDTTRTPLEAGLMRYAESKFVFVIEDPFGNEVV